MKLYTLEEMLDKEFGPIGTAERDKFEEEVANSLNEDKMGHTLKDTRIKENATRETLEAKAGMKEEKVAGMENGHCSNISSMDRAFHALGANSITMDLSSLGALLM